MAVSEKVSNACFQREDEGRERTRMMAVLLVYSHRRQGFSSANTLKFWPALPSASGLPPAMRRSFLLGISDGAGAPKLMLHRLDDVCSTADCTCGTATGSPPHMYV